MAALEGWVEYMMRLCSTPKSVDKTYIDASDVINTVPQPKCFIDRIRLRDRNARRSGTFAEPTNEFYLKRVAEAAALKGRIKIYQRSKRNRLAKLARAAAQKAKELELERLRSKEGESHSAGEVPSYILESLAAREEIMSEDEFMETSVCSFCSRGIW